MFNENETDTWRGKKKRASSIKSVIWKLFSIFFILLFSGLVNAQADDQEEKEQKEKTYVLEPIEVRGKRARDLLAEPMLESPGLELSTTVVNEYEIEKQGAKSIIDALEYVPGAWVETRGRKVKQFFSVRGQKYPYPGYAVDGTWQREFHEMPYFFSATDIERIEVIRSSAALLKGPSGLAGIVNIIPKKYRNPETSTEMEYGTFDTYRFHMSHGATVKDLSYAIGLGAHHTEGPEGKNAAEGMTNFRGSVDWRPMKKLSVRTNLFHIYGKREMARAEPPAASKFREGTEKFDPFQATLANAKAYYRPNEKASTELLLHYTDRHHTFISEDDTSHESNREWDYEWGMNLIQSLSFLKNNVIRAGGFYNHWIAPEGKRFYAGNRCDLETVSAVVVDEHKFGSLSLNAGLRWAKTYMNEYAKAREAFNVGSGPKLFRKLISVTDEWQPSVLNGSIGAAYNLSKRISLNFNLAAGQIQPREGALDVNGKEPKNEKRVKLDGGVQATQKGIGQLSVVGFYTQRKDAIVFSGESKEVEGQIMEFYMNRDQDRLGVEFEARSVPLLNSAQFFLNVTAMKSRAESEGEMTRNKELPQLIMSGGIYASKSKLDLNIFGKFISSYESTRFVPKTKGPQPLGDFFTLNATAGWSFGEKDLTKIYLEGKNLTDEKFYTVVGYSDFGRRITIGLRRVFR